MDFDPQTLSIFVTVLVIIAAMGTALVVDLLKGNVEQLREVAIDLRARKDAAEQQVRMLQDQVATQQRKAVAGGTESPKVLEDPGAAATTPALLSPAVSRGASSPKAEAPSRKMSPAVAAVAESVAAKMAAGGFRPGPDAEIIPPTPASMPSERSAGAASARKNWNELLKMHKRGGEQAEENGVNNLIPFEAFRQLDSLPGGYHDYAVLQRVAASGQRFTGLAISIGMNPMDRMQVGLVTGYLRSLLEVRDFGCMTGSHEFLMVCNQVEGEIAQRRLAAVAEKLWDFQLRSMGSMPVQFSWGAKESHNESLNDVVASAIDQMQETRRARPAAVSSPVVGAAAGAGIEFQQAV